MSPSAPAPNLPEAAEQPPVPAIESYPLAPLIRFTLVLLYLALVLPLPLLAPAELRLPLAVAVPLGLLIVWAITSEQVQLDASGIRVGHPRWCSWWLRRGWTLPWSAVSGLTAVATSQGGRVFYVRSGTDGGAWLLPQRVHHFDRFLQHFSTASGVDCSQVRRLTPAWTYRLLAVLSATLLVAETAALLLLPSS